MKKMISTFTLNVCEAVLRFWRTSIWSL